MFFEKIEVENFRNISSAVVAPAGGANVFTGANGQGKTSLLEAVFLLCTNQKIRSKQHAELVKKGELFSRVVVLARDEETAPRGQEQKTTLQISIPGKTKKEFFEGGVKKQFRSRRQKRPCMLFLPDDLRLFAGAPSRRRSFLDTVASQIENRYTSNHRRLTSTLRNRNKLLEETRRGAKSDENLMSILTERLIKEGAWVWQARRHAFVLLQKQYNEIIVRLWKQKETPQISLKTDIVLIEEEEQIEQKYRKKIEKKQARERAFGRTLVGPHHDEISLLYKGDEFSGRASRGEQRTVVLALKLAQAAVLEEFFKTKPVLLLDDVFSELDQEHRARIEEETSTNQLFVTSLETHVFSSPFLSQARRFDVANGDIKTH